MKTNPMTHRPLCLPITEEEKALAHRRLCLLFAETSPARIDQALELTVTRSFEEGAVVLVEGSLADELLVLCSGRLKIYGRDATGALLPIATIHEPGQLIGEQAFAVDRQFRNGTAIALVATRVAVLPGTEFKALLAGDATARLHLAISGRSQSREKLLALFGELGELTEQAPIAAPIPRQLTAGTVLFSAGDTAAHAYFVLSGEMGLFHPGCPVPHETIGPGLLLGDREVLERKRRTLQAAAITNSEVLAIEAAELSAVGGKKSSLGTILEGLAYVHSIPQFGSAYRFLGHVNGEACVVTDYRQENGLRLRVRHFPQQRRTEAARIEKSRELTETISSPDGGSSLLLAAGTGSLLGLAAPQDWPQLPEAMALLLRGGSLADWQVDAFRANGDVLIEDASLRASGGSEIVCGCTNTTSAALRRAAERATTVDDLIRLTGAGGICGGCRGRLPAFLNQSDYSLCHLHTEPLTEGVLLARLEPIPPAVLPPAKIGQHIRIEAMMDERWVGRPYTLTAFSPTRYELGVKLEEGGLFSNWLRQAAPGTLLRVSAPSGAICPQDDDTRPLVYFVAGIGVTPAIAAVRVLRQRRLTIIYSFRHPTTAAYLSELRTAAHRGRLQLFEHDTAQQSRLSAGDVAAYVRDVGSCEVIVCGPAAFNATVLAALGTCPEVSASAESFDHPQRGEGAQLAPGAWRQKDFQPTRAFAPPVESPTTLPATEQAAQFIREFYHESTPAQDPSARVSAVQAQLTQTGVWVKTFEELAFATRVAWRNAERCVGRLYWQGLHLRDCRQLREPAEIAEALWDHLRFAFNGGELRPAISVFDPGSPREPGPRIWNPQLMRYAGYRLRSGKQVGDPAQNDLTQRIIALGWRPPGTDFDLLPIVIETAAHGPRWYELPSDCRWEIPITHLQHPWLATLKLKWYAIPAVSDMALDAGGMVYRLLPFNGWYLDTEIAARNLSDVNRYNLLPRIGECMGLDIRSDRTLWRDKALLLLNEAVLQSFDRSGVKMSDHHHVGHEFLEFCRNEQKSGREPYGNWTWLVPPAASSTSVLYQEPFHDKALKPAYVYQAPAWTARSQPSNASPGTVTPAPEKCPFH